MLLGSCASLIERIEMSNPRLSCVKKEGSEEYSVFDIRFKRKSETISLVPSKSYCFRSGNSSGFSGTFETNAIISRTKENHKLGNGAFLQLTILNTKNLEEKYKTSEELDKAVTTLIYKRVLEIKNNTNPRFSEFVNNLGKFRHGNNSKCQDLFQSVHDSRAANLPKSEKYLVMNSFYKSCSIPQLEVFIDIGLSVRANKDYIKNFDSEYLKNYVIKIEESLVDKKSQRNLRSIIAD